MQRERRAPVGVRIRHSRRCSVESGGACNCKPSFEAAVYSVRDAKKLRKTFKSIRDAREWRAAAEASVRRGTLRCPTRTTVREAAEAWLEGAAAGSIRNRSGDPFKPSVLRGYERALRLRVVPELGRHRMSDVTRNDVQDLADQLVARGLDPSSVRNAIVPLRTIYRRAVARGEVAVNPTEGIELPAVRGRRERIAAPAEAAALLTALPMGDRALWGTAMYAGLRLGELRALHWEDVDLAGGVIRVSRSWDEKAGLIAPKSRAGERRVPIPGVLRDLLIEHRMEADRGAGLVFGRQVERTFEPSTVRRRALVAWSAAALVPIGFHEARHTFASLMIAAGVNAKALSTYMGHSSVTITLDRYGHLLPGSESEAAGLLSNYLAISCSDVIPGAATSAK